MNDIYWLAASIGGCISSSRGDPFELINLPNVGRLLRTGIDINPEWGNGSFFSAMISFTTTRSDLNEIMLRDSVDYYFDKAILYSDGKDAGPYLAYAESIHKPFQERKNFVDKLNYVINMENKPNNEFELTNLLAKSRAKWLLARTEEYFRMKLKFLIIVLYLSTLQARNVVVKMATLAPEGTDWHGMLIEMGRSGRKQLKVK